MLYPSPSGGRPDQLITFSALQRMCRVWPNVTRNRWTSLISRIVAKFQVWAMSERRDMEPFQNVRGRRTLSRCAWSKNSSSARTGSQLRFQLSMHLTSRGQRPRVTSIDPGHVMAMFPVAGWEDDTNLASCDEWCDHLHTYLLLRKRKNHLSQWLYDIGSFRGKTNSWYLVVQFHIIIWIIDSQTPSGNPFKFDI